MSPDRWRRVGELFHEALEIAPAERSAWIDRVCAGETELRGELVSLLESDRAASEGFVHSHLKAAVVSFYEHTSETRRIRRAGPYRLVRELGRGGMGTVYLAERDDDQYQTKVAIKLVRPGSDTELILRRFRRERQILAHLQHPNIARLLDGGTTEDGLPYIVMEHIDGSRITEYCEAGALDLRQRLTLFLDVCSAVAYAHQRFVVHRDIKPGNILVDQNGRAKLLDFGICKLLQADPLAPDETGAAGVGMLTPDYASPEQIQGDLITVASDVYSLAAVLYELLTGVRPHRIEKYTLREIQHAICEQEILRPSLAAPKSLARRLRGDLDNIIMLALQKDPLRRYATVDQLSNDLQRYLACRPVRARPDTVAYRARKFLRRQRGPLAAVAAVILSLAAGMFVALREARTANQNLMQVRSLANTFVFDVHDAVRDLPGSTRARRLIVETGLKYLDSLAQTSRRDTALEQELAAAYERIGDVQGDVLEANLGNTASALESYRKGLALTDAILARDPANRRAQATRATLYQRIGGIHSYTEDSRLALESYRQAQRLDEAILASDAGDQRARQELAEIHLRIGDVLRAAGDYPASFEENSKGLASFQQFVAARPADRPLQYATANAYINAGLSEIRLGRLEDALAHFRQAVAQMDELARQEPANLSYQRGLMLAYSHVGDVLGSPNMPSLGDAAGAMDAYRRIQSVAHRLYESDPADQRAARDYAIALARVASGMPDNKPAAQVPLLEESARLLQEVARVNPENLVNRADLAHGYNMLGDALYGAGDRAAAVAAYRQSATLSETMLDSGQGSPVVTLVSVSIKLARDAARRGDRESSLTDARRALDVTDPSSAAARKRPDILQRFLTPRGPTAMGLVYADLARVRNTLRDQAQKDRADALEWLEKSLAGWRKVESDPAFAPSRRKEMQQVEIALASLQKPSSTGR
jgi:tetratricopeptide (TPR) repeat protein